MGFAIATWLPTQHRELGTRQPVSSNRYFDHAEKRGLRFDGLTPDELVAQRLSYVERTRKSYQAFWEENVRTKA